jgi:tetratricopeptide (TPR) repeat protein
MFTNVRARGMLCAVLMLLTAVPAGAQAPPPAPSAKEQAAAALLTPANWPAAVVAYRELVEVEPTNPRAAFGLGVALHETGKYADAIEALSRADLQGYQPVNQVRFRLARAEARAGKVEEALSRLERLAAAGFSNTAVLQLPDLEPLRAQARFQAFARRVQANAHPFWIGQWDVQPTGSARGPIGTGSSSVIEKHLDGCVIQENWLTPGTPGEGKSFNTYNTALKRWEQYWVDSRGTITHYVGNFRDDGGLYYEADQFGTTNKIRMTFFNQGPNQVRQLGHTSTDGGKTWAVSFDLTYVRKP